MNNAIVPAAHYEAQNAYQRLQACLSTDDLKIAIMEIKTFLKIYPDVAMACNDLGVLYSQAGEKLLALACYEKANRLQPGHPTIVKNLAEFYFVELGWTDDAIIMLTGLLRHFPEESEILALLGTISERIGRGGEACSFYRKSLEIDPGNSGVRKAVERLEGEVSAPAAPAEPVLQTAAQPTEPPKSSQLGDILARLRTSMGASKPVAEPSRQAEQASDELYREAQAYAAAGDNDKAIETLERLVAVHPAYAIAYNDLGVLYSRLGDMQKAHAHHEAAVTRNPSNTTFRKNLAALCYSGLGRTDEAIGIYTRLLQEHPDDVETLTALAIISEANNLNEQARTFIGKVLELEPWNTAARDFLAKL